MSNINEVLKKNMDFVRDNTSLNMDFVYLQLNNIRTLVGNEEFLRELKDTLDQVFDRNDDGCFDVKDLMLLKDIFKRRDTQVMNIYNFVMELFNSVVALIAKVNKTVFKIDKDAIEGLFFGTVTYCLFQYSYLTPNDKKYVVYLMITIYSTVRTVDNTLNISKKIMKLLRRKGWCKCIHDNTYEVEKEVIRSRERMRELSNTVKTTGKLTMKVEELEKRLNDKN